MLLPLCEFQVTKGVTSAARSRLVSISGLPSAMKSGTIVPLSPGALATYSVVRNGRSLLAASLVEQEYSVLVAVMTKAISLAFSAAAS